VRVVAARFEGAAARPGEAPPAGPPEIAIAGRSNVGKSSLINAVLDRRGLARTSGTPGRTRQLNFFLVNGRFRLVDLPGYGYAAGPERERLGWGPLVETYLRERETLCGVVVIIDVRRGIEAEEIELLAFLAELGCPAVLVATKIDKLGRGAATTALRKLEATAGGRVPVIGFSARTREGPGRFWAAVLPWIETSRAPGGARSRRGGDRS
jgi:GTP-binding protein